MKRYLLLLLLLFVANNIHASSISYLTFSEMLIRCKTYHICRYLRTEGNSLVLADRKSGKEFIVRSDDEGDTAAVNSYLVLEDEKSAYVIKHYPHSTENDQIVEQLSSEIRDIDKMPDSEKKFRACKRWIFTMIEVPFLHWYGFYEWQNNKIIGDYIKEQRALIKAGKSSSFKILTRKESEKFYKAFLTFRWPDFNTWDALWFLDSSYNDRIVRHVCQFLEWTLTEAADDFENVESKNSICDFCAVRVLSGAHLGGEEFLKIVGEYDKDNNKFTDDSDKVYIRRMVDALKKQFSR